MTNNQEFKIRIIPNSPMIKIVSRVKVSKRKNSFEYFVNNSKIVDINFLFNYYFKNKIVCPLSI